MTCCILFYLHHEIGFESSPKVMLCSPTKNSHSRCTSITSSAQTCWKLNCPSKLLREISYVYTLLNILHSFIFIVYKCWRIRHKMSGRWLNVALYLSVASHASSSVFFFFCTTYVNWLASKSEHKKLLQREAHRHINIKNITFNQIIL
jgi:hypothetical protein